MTGRDAAQYLRNDGACKAACEYVASHGTLDEAIARATRLDWLYWLTRYDVGIAVRFAQWCAADAARAARAAYAARAARAAYADAYADAAAYAARAARAAAADAAAAAEQLTWLKDALKTFKLPEYK